MLLLLSLCEIGAPERSRTPNPQIRSLVLYPIELRAPAAKRAGDGGGNNYSRGTRKRKVDRGRRRKPGGGSQAARDVGQIMADAAASREWPGMSSETAVISEAIDDGPAARPSVGLLPALHKRAEAGHPWIYANEVRMDAAARALPPGTLVTLRRADDSALGVAMFNPHCLLAARLLDRDAGRSIGGRFWRASSNARCGCASGCSTNPITVSFMPRPTGCPVSSSTVTGQFSRCSRTPPASPDSSRSSSMCLPRC